MTTPLGATKSAPKAAPAPKYASEPAPAAKPGPAPKPRQVHPHDAFEPAKRHGRVSRGGTNDDSI